MNNKSKFLKFIILIVINLILTCQNISYKSQRPIEMLEYLNNETNLINESSYNNFDKIRKLIKIKPKFKINKKIYFLKTHKTASSTLYNIFGRITIEKNLKLLVVPKTSIIDHFWPKSFHTNLFDTSYENNFDIFIEHARFNKEECEKFFPKQGSFYVSIMRNPVKQWLSTYTYFKFDTVMSIKSFLNLIKKYNLYMFYNFVPRLIKLNHNSNLIHNGQIFDFGYNSHKITYFNLNQIKYKLDNQFNLVIITEYFDEGLVVLKNMLNLTFLDIAYLKVNEVIRKNKEILDDSDYIAINQLTLGDRYIYKHFKNKFENLYLYDKTLQSEFKTFKNLLNLIEYVCVDGRKEKKAFYKTYYLGYQLRQDLEKPIFEFCELMTLSELEFRCRLIEKIQKNYPNFKTDKKCMT